jgi:glycylpeptide N-tetradecanoyltransferase
MSSSQKGKAEEEYDDPVNGVVDEDDGDPASPVGETANASEGGSTSKQKKKASKATKALNALRGKKEIPQEIVNRVVDKVKAEQGEGGSADVDANNVRLALEQLKLLDVLQGKVGLWGKNKKDMGEHKVMGPASAGPLRRSDQLSESSGKRNPSLN